MLCLIEKLVLVIPSKCMFLFILKFTKTMLYNILLVVIKILEKKLYIDEFVYFLPFIEELNLEIYTELIDSILKFRKMSYDDKLELFKSTPNYEDIFANCMHEINYYFLRIFAGFGCLEIVSDYFHNNGKLFSFRHGSGNTYRTDAYASRKNGC